MRSESESSAFDAFDPETELFLSNAPTVPELEPLELEVELALGLGLAPPPRRRALGLWVIGAMILCALLLLASALSR
jgi:hypothetical protein